MVTIVNNQWGNITKDSDSNRKVKLWLHNINMTCTEDTKSDEENANLLLGNNDLKI